MKRENLNFEPFYYVEPMRIIDDPIESINEFMKYDKEKNDIKLFLKDCSVKDFIWAIITIFRDKFADGALLGSFISNTSQKQPVLNEALYIKKPSYRHDLKNFKFKYNSDDHFEYLEFELVNPLTQITNIVEESLTGKNYSKNVNKYLLISDSGIDYIEVTPYSFKLSANMEKSKKFH